MGPVYSPPLFALGNRSASSFSAPPLPPDLLSAFVPVRLGKGPSGMSTAAAAADTDKREGLFKGRSRCYTSLSLRVLQRKLLQLASLFLQLLFSQVACSTRPIKMFRLCQEMYVYRPTLPFPTSLLISTKPISSWLLPSPNSFCFAPRPIPFPRICIKRGILTTLPRSNTFVS